MKRCLLPAISALGLLLAASSGQAGLPDGRAITAATSISPDVHLFADPAVARVLVVVDANAFDPDRISVETGFAPYDVDGEVERERRKIGDVVELEYRTTLRCLRAECLAPRYRTVLGEQESGRPERYTFRFPPAEVRYLHPDGRVELLLQRPFPALEVVSRINTAQLEAADPLSDPGLGDPAAASGYTAGLEPPAPTYRLPPRVLAGVAFALAGLLLVFPAWLAGRALLARWRAARRPRRLPPAERALLLVEWASLQEDGDEDRRRALEALAEVLEQEGVEPLAETARSSAWAQDGADGARASELAHAARSAFGGRWSP